MSFGEVLKLSHCRILIGLALSICRRGVNLRWLFLLNAWSHATPRFDSPDYDRNGYDGHHNEKENDLPEL